MLVLCLDTATPAVTAALVEVGPSGPTRTLAERSELDARAHGERLAPLVAEVLAAAGARPGDLGALAAGTGPGPYTSLRVGVVSAATMAAALAIPAYGACSLDLLGLEAGEGCVVATDARRGEVYWARYGADGSRLAGPAVDRPEVLATRLGAGERLVGDGARRHEGALGRPAGPPWHAAARFLADLVAERARAGAPGEVLAPRYLRRPDAREPVRA